MSDDVGANGTGGSDLRGEDGVRRLAELAALELTDAEAEALAEELREILGHFEVIREVEGGRGETGGHRGTGTARGWLGEDRAPLRPDDPGPDPLGRAPGEDAPGFQDGFFTVPRLASHRGGEGAEERGGAE